MLKFIVFDGRQVERVLAFKFVVHQKGTNILIIYCSYLQFDAIGSRQLNFRALPSKVLSNFIGFVVDEYVVGI